MGLNCPIQQSEQLMLLYDILHVFGTLVRREHNRYLKRISFVFDAHSLQVH